MAQARVDAYFSPAKTPGKATKKPELRLYMPVETALELYGIWVNSQYTALPFSGAYMEQPYWVRRDFGMLSDLQAWHRKQAETKKPKDKRPDKPLKFDQL